MRSSSDYLVVANGPRAVFVVALQRKLAGVVAAGPHLVVIHVLLGDANVAVTHLAHHRDVTHRLLVCPLPDQEVVHRGHLGGFPVGVHAQRDARVVRQPFDVGAAPYIASPGHVK